MSQAQAKERARTRGRRTEQLGAVLETGHLGDDRQDRDEDARRTDTGERATKDEDLDRVRDGADERAELEDDDGREVGPLAVGEREDLAVQQEEGGLGEEVCRHDPSLRAVKVEEGGRDGGRGGRREAQVSKSLIHAHQDIDQGRDAGEGETHDLVESL